MLPESFLGLFNPPNTIKTLPGPANPTLGLCRLPHRHYPFCTTSTTDPPTPSPPSLRPSDFAFSRYHHPLLLLPTNFTTPRPLVQHTSPRIRFQDVHGPHERFGRLTWSVDCSTWTPKAFTDTLSVQMCGPSKRCARTNQTLWRSELVRAQETFHTTFETTGHLNAQSVSERFERTDVHGPTKRFGRSGLVRAQETPTPHLYAQSVHGRFGRTDVHGPSKRSRRSDLVCAPDILCALSPNEHKKRERLVVHAE
ncbi:hypothetical protein D9758_016518 [Tetrapyrgos nigripes]|uniref:Uncharacterized protein n=1 Tax=Tetrapyrgos nigripes TaxID=182062 RepID=A0A8H5CN72_9AGAR|nr:hypothetical protein D9758_016518 [Tetrapyrgos nigripes]